MRNEEMIKGHYKKYHLKITKNIQETKNLAARTQQNSVVIM